MQKILIRPSDFFLKKAPLSENNQPNSKYVAQLAIVCIFK